MIATMASTDFTYVSSKRSMNNCEGDFSLCAFWTRVMIFWNKVSLLGFVTSTLIVPVAFTVPAKTSKPAFLLTGMDSPVIAASSMDVSPNRMIPSEGTLSPGLIRMRSPTTKSPTGITSSLSPMILKASSG